MALPNAFSTQTQSTGPQLDQNFAALGLLTPITCTASGTNAVTLTPLADTPTVSAYANYQPFSLIVASTNTGAASAMYAGLSALSVYKDSGAGPLPLVGGEMVAGNQVFLVYDSALGSGSGGFHLLTSALGLTPAMVEVATVTSSVGVTLTAANMTGGGNRNAVILRTGTAGAAFSDTTDTAAAIVGAIPGAVAGTKLSLRYINTTGSTATLAAGTGVSVNATNATTANGATHDFIGVINSTSTASVTFYG